MTLWLVRAGRDGEHATLFAEQGRVGVGFGFPEDVSLIGSRDELMARYQERHPGYSTQQMAKPVGQMWTLARAIETGNDHIIVPFKRKRAFRIAKVTGDYRFDPSFSEEVPHTRPIKWVSEDIPRTAFGQDLLNSLGAIMTVCRIYKNDAENRIMELAGSPAPQTPSPSGSAPVSPPDGDVPEDDSLDMEERAADEIERTISKNFRGPDGYDMERLVKALLEAQGYTVYQSPKGRDKGVDLLAAPGPLGFGTPRICVQVKSGDGKTGRPTLDQLVGTMQNFQAEQGLLVSWGGFTKDVEDAEATQFFKVRLWGKQALIDELLSNYEKLNSDVKLELPLKQIWTVVHDPDE